jgi:L-arabinose isomerase
MAPDRRHPVKAGAHRAPINPSVSKSRTEVEPSLLGLGVEQPAAPPTQ